MAVDVGLLWSRVESFAGDRSPDELRVAQAYLLGVRDAASLLEESAADPHDVVALNRDLRAQLPDMPLPHNDGVEVGASWALRVMDGLRAGADFLSDRLSCGEVH